MDDIQSWWEVPSIAHFCSLFRVAFNLLDFDIEELEEALLTDGAELTGSSLLQELIVRLLCGCLGNNGISIFNYQMFLRRLFRTKCRELGRTNPFDTDIDFQSLPLRTKVEILHALCDFRLDADDVIDVLKNLDSDSLRVHPLGHDENKSAYWYFYGTRLYREDFPKKRKKKKDHDKQKSKKKRHEESSSSEEDEDPKCGSWRVLCFTEEDWQKLADSMADSTCKEEQALYSVLTEDFLPEIPRLFEEKERLQRKRLLENQPRRTSSRLEKLKSQRAQENPEPATKSREERYLDRERERLNKEKQRRAARALRRSRSKSESGSSAGESTGAHYTGRQTNNSLSSATGKIIIQPTRQKFRTSQLFRRTREDLMTGLYKVLDRLKTHEDAWPFVDPVEEEYAPKYYSVIAKPMDLKTMESKVDNGAYGSLQQFKSDFQLIVDNCRQYNGSDNEYTQMVSRLHEAFQALVDRYLEIEASSEEETIPEIMQRRGRYYNSPSPSIDREHSKSPSCDSNSENENNEFKKIETRQEKGKIRENFDDETSDSKSQKSKFKKKASKERNSKEEESCNENTKSRETSLDRSRERCKVNYKETETSDYDEFSDASKSSKKSENPKVKKLPHKTVKKTGVIKNVAAIEALELATEQTLKDINKWLDDTPRFSDFSSNSNSPLHVPCTEEMASIEGEYRRRLQLDKPVKPRDRSSNDLHRRKMLKEQMGIKRRREVQRTIDRLQPGKSKGNLLSKENQQQDGPGSETKFSSVDSDENTPKISLGKVLPSELLSFGICDSSRKESEDECTQDKFFNDDHSFKSNLKEEKLEDNIDKEPLLVDVNKSSNNVDEKDQKKEKPTPNLSAWFKAFGAPKLQNNLKKKTENEETRPSESIKQQTVKEDEGLIGDDKDKRLGLILNVQSPARRQRKTSTGSSVSERSSFSQEPLDGNSPRPSLDEPYLSPQPEVKTYYHSPINGTIKVGFYQDTCFPKGSSEKSSSPRELPNSSPKELPSTSPMTPYCSPRNPLSPRELQNCSPREYHCASPNGASPKELTNASPTEGSAPSPKNFTHSPKSHYPPYSSAPDYQSKNKRLYSYPPHISYYDTSKAITDQYKNAEKVSAPVYPVKKRIYNEIETSVIPKSSPEHVSSSVNKCGSFTPTKEAMEQDRTFTPTPGRIPTQPLRISDSSLPIGLHHPLQHHIMDTYNEDRHCSTFFSSEGLYNKGQPSTNPHSVFAQPSVISSSYNRESNIQESTESPQQNEKCSPQNFNRLLPQYHSESRTEKLNYQSPSPDKTVVASYQNRNDSLDEACTSPLNYSNANNIDSSSKEATQAMTFLNRQQEITKPPSPVRYNKVVSSDLLSPKVSAPFPYSSNSLEEIFPTKVNSSYNRSVSHLAPSINFDPNSEISKITVPTLAYSNQSELLASKINYNHSIMQSSSRYNYQMSELMQGKSGVCNQAMQDLIQGKPPAYSNMIQGNLSSYNRPVTDIMQSKVSDIQSRDMAYSSKALPPNKPDPPTKSKKSRKKKSETSSGFQQYVAPALEAISLKTSGVSGSAFNFAPPVKDSYSTFLEEMRSPYYVPHTEGSSTKGATSPYFLGHASTRAPTYPHPFMNAQYQQYLQRHPEELLRPMMIPPPPQVGSLLTPPANYPAGYLGMHDAINRPSWL